MVKIPSKNIPRPVYLSQIRPYIRKNLIKVLSGQRRVGKSYLLFQIMEEIRNEHPRANITYINKEDLSFDFIRNADDLNQYILSQAKNTGTHFIFIDEIQDIVEFERALRSLLLDENNDLYITGSNARMLSGELATYLSGRFIEFNIFSLSYPEFLKFHKLDENEENLQQYIKYGGLPYLINLPLNDQVFEYLDSIYTTIIYRDVVSRYNLRSSQVLEQLVQFLADNIGSLFSAKKISDFLKSQKIHTAPNLIQQYASYLNSAFIIHEVNRFDIVGRRIFEIGHKYYFENTGIRNAITGYRIKDMGKLLENVVYNHLLFLGYKVKIGILHQQEIDFIAERRGELLYVQVAVKLESEATVEREFGNLLMIKDNYPKLVISDDHFEGNTYNGITHMHIRQFLMSENLHTKV
ncbi:MAG: ATP-binding protein [Bacteroidota bacterium]|nr:ATP-binding protein [Bacteroidota bacterium]